MRVSCQVIALLTGSPLSAYQSTVVSRWLAIPRATRSAAVRFAPSSDSLTTVSTLAQISLGSCSTQPGRGYWWRCSFWATETIRAASSKIRQREEAVP